MSSGRSMSRCVIMKEVGHDAPDGCPRGRKPEIEDHLCMSLFPVARIAVSFSICAWIISACMHPVENWVCSTWITRCSTARARSTWKGCFPTTGISLKCSTVVSPSRYPHVLPCTSSTGVPGKRGTRISGFARCRAPLLP